jgi:2'-5' RNA ligase
MGCIENSANPLGWKSMPCGNNGSVPINCYALVAYIPGPLGEFLDHLRRELVPACAPRAHVTILPPRPVSAPPGTAVEQLNEWIAGIPAFEIETRQVEIFDTTSVIYIGLGTGREDLKRIHGRLNAGHLGFAEPFGYHPHITLAQDLSPDRVSRAHEEAKRRWAEFEGERTFRVETVTFVQNTSDNRWLDLAHWTLGAVPTPR